MCIGEPIHLMSGILEYTEESDISVIIFCLF